MKPLLIQPFEAEAAIGAYHIVKPGTSYGQAILAAANSDTLIGIKDALAADLGDNGDIVMQGIGEVILGGNVARGEFITADASGHGVKLTDTMLQSGACNSIGICLKTGVSGDIVPIFIIPQKVSKFDAVTASAAEINKLDGAPLDATIVVGTEGTNTINVAIQLKDADGVDLVVRGSIKAYLSDDANGDSIVATAPSGGGAIGTDGLAIPLVANKCWLLTSESDGDIDITFTETGTKTMYLILILPNGKLKASGAITFAA
jgi:hypothetical protein